MRILIFCSIFFLSKSFAIVLFPMSVEGQLKDAYGVIHGIYLDKSFKKLTNEEVVTELSLKVIRSTGLNPSELINKNNFKVVYPGGIFQGVTYTVPGSPNFEKGEEVVLILKKNKYGFLLSKLSLGKYNVKSRLGKIYLQNDAFPEHSKLGNISYESFEDSLFEVYGARLSIKGQDFHISQAGKGAEDSLSNSRQPASVVEKDKKYKESRLSMFWLMVILSSLGLFSNASLRSKE